MLGEFIGTVDAMDAVHTIVRDLLTEQQQRTGYEVSMREKFSSRAVHSLKIPDISPPSILKERIRDRATYFTHAIGLYVDGKKLAVVANQEAADSILAAVKEQYEDLLESDGRTQVETVEFVENVECRPHAISPGEIQDAEAVRMLLVQGTDKEETHIIQKGESLWTIASARGLTVDEIRQANPQIRDVDLIHPGDSISLVVADPYLTIKSTETYWYIRYLPYQIQTHQDSTLWPWQRIVQQAGRRGEEKVMVRISREAGLETTREVLRVERLSEPVTHIVTQGTKTIPNYGTGRFILPAAGPVTSGFGWRRRGWHTGIDMAMSVGTPIHAADSGMVVSAGWQSGYGQTIRIDHGQGRFVTVYAHLSRIAVNLGQVVETGQVIGYSGNTGNSTGPHLHFEIRVDGVPRDPTDFFPD